MSEVHHAPHAKRFAVGEVDECAIGSYVRFEDYEALRKQYDHTYAVTLAKLQAAEARAVRCEGVVSDAAFLMSRRLEGAAMVDSYLAAYRLLFSHLHPEDGDAASS